MMTTPHERPHQSLPLVYVTLALANAAEAVEVLSAGFILNRATDDTAGQTIAAGVFVGMLVGGFVSGAVSDTVGRVPALRWSLALAALAAAAAAAAPNLETLVLIRVLAGMGVGAATPPLFALATEYAPAGKSGPAVALVASFWMVGSIVAASLALLLLSNTADQPPSFAASAAWRTFALACSVVPAISTILAGLVLSRSHGPSASRSPSTRSTGSADLVTTSADGPSTASTTAAQLAAFIPPALAPSTPRLDLAGVLRTLFDPPTRSRLLPLLLVWFGLNFGSYGLSTWITAILANAGVQDPYLVSLLFALAMLPGNAVSIFFVDRLGRRPLLVRPPPLLHTRDPPTHPLRLARTRL